MLSLSMPIPSLATVDEMLLPEFTDAGISVHMLRLDKIHPVISGNKWFKLKYYLNQAIEKKHKSILTFGGAYSNHLVASAYAASLNSLHSIGIVRGEEPRRLSHTLTMAREFGMQLKFISRSEYANKLEKLFIQNIQNEFPDALIIPEGGAGEWGVLGAQSILDRLDNNNFSHIICAVGTGTMFSGIARSMKENQMLIGISVLKGPTNMFNVINEFASDENIRSRCIISNDYHLCGYAIKTEALRETMNRIYIQTGIPTDFVYTGKMCYATIDLCVKRLFNPGSSVLLIHSGGLQGNASLPAGYLDF